MLALAFGVVVRAEGPDDQYVKIYNMIRQADDLSQTGQRRSAYQEYEQAKKALEDLAKAYPDWRRSLIEFRLNYINAKLAQFGPPPAAPTTTPSPGGTNLLEAPLAAGEATNQINALATQVRALTADKTMLEAKLREALAAQPATVEPRELAKAEERIRSLQKENELLKLSLQQDQSKMAKMASPTALEAAQKALAEANRKLAEQNQTIAALTQEKQVLQSRLAAAPAAPAAAPKTTAAPAKAAVTPPTSDQFDLLQAENEFLKKRIADLENKVQSTAPSKSSKAAPNSDNGAAANKSEKTKNNQAADESGQLNRQLAALQARLDVLDARKTPYSPEELAMFKAPEPATAPHPAEEKTVATTVKSGTHSLPAGAGALVAEARQAFAGKHYLEAEQKYMEVLKLDENNVSTLGDLAAIQLEENRLDDAAANLKRALALDSNDAFNLRLWGILKFRQHDYDTALDALSRSAKIDPNNADTQNYLGITLSQKGQRDAAEAALRKAIQLDPNNAGAHHNLAIVYATQKPPFLALARYHYQKALALGHPRNAELEKMLDSPK